MIMLLKKLLKEFTDMFNVDSSINANSLPNKSQYSVVVKGDKFSVERNDLPLYAPPSMLYIDICNTTDECERVIKLHIKNRKQAILLNKKIHANKAL